MKRYFSLLLFFCVIICANGQNVILGTNGFLTLNPNNNYSGFGFYTRMGVELFESEIGLKTFYGRLSQNQGGQYFEQEAYGVSFYTFVPFYQNKRFELVGHAEGGISLGYSNFGGSNTLVQMGIGPGIKYKVRDYLDFELVVEYVLMSPLTNEPPSIISIIIPTLGWSVRI